MSVGFKIDFLRYEIGHGDFLHSFFSTISYHLEPEGWGTKYPYLLNHLYNGKLCVTDVAKAVTELEEVRSKLTHFSPNEVIWDIENLNKKPPWGTNISGDITNLSNYFVTSDGRDLFDVIFVTFKDSQDLKVNIEIE
ncbi:immunity 70 family protein [Pelosinus sp. UFO1]|uniref:immunity 70 family protein n=1 Tax=Pelosinus sp. UFO1 TaxID=484770 RepID=UPI0004D1D5B7|nr:immunity 70 family protein [Pelosinus sp. UFO1]AIF51855.1 hypothetical protein UFO1_2308 [Pelosinus sp. UFO1]